jgi:hypothetical protein
MWYESTVWNPDESLSSRLLRSDDVTKSTSQGCSFLAHRKSRLYQAFLSESVLADLGDMT